MRKLQINDLSFCLIVNNDQSTNGSVSNPPLVTAKNGHAPLAIYLINKCANVRQVDMEGDTVLRWAAYAVQTDLVQFQCRFELNPAQVDTFDQTPLHKACVKGSVNTVREALKKIERCVIHWLPSRIRLKFILELRSRCLLG